MTIKIAITGVSGRMGKALAEAVQQHTNTVLGAATVRAGNSLTGADAGELIGMGKVGVVIASDLNDVIDDVDAVIDFTSPAATLAHTEICATKKKPIIIGTTGFTEEEKNTLEALSQRLPVVLASNFSTGVNVSFKLLDVAARIFGDDADIEVYEAHHRHKVDAPSGTALSMGEVLADALGRKLTDVAVYGREGQVGARPKNEIGFATARGGDVVGEHTVSFFADGERLEITHKASSRMAFAHGAVRAAIWACDQQVGIFDMQDVLGLK